MQSEQPTPEEQVRLTKIDLYGREIAKLIGEIEHAKIKADAAIKKLVDKPNFYHGHGNDQQFGGILRDKYDPVRLRARVLKDLILTDLNIPDKVRFESQFYSPTNEGYADIGRHADNAIEALRNLLKAVYGL